MNTLNKLDNLEVAIRKNTYLPEQDEEVMHIYPPLKCSPRYEGHGQMAIILFIGLAKYGGLPSEDVCNKICVEHDEWYFKLKDFEDRRKALTEDGARFRNKIKLVNNYLKLHYGYETN